MLHWFQLRDLAKQEYEQARGTAHKRLLHVAKEWHEREEQRLITSVASTHHQKNLINQKYSEALEKVLVHVLVHEHLQEVPGIGPQRKAQILQHVFRGRLSDLSRAYQLQGVGQQTQQALNNWIVDYTQRLPVLLNQNFAGRAAIDQQYQPEVEKVEQQLASLVEQQKQVQAKITRIDQELKWLDAISQKDFYKALRSSEQTSPTLNRYVQGVFGEWETMPDWFRQALEGVEDISRLSAQTEKLAPDKQSSDMNKWLVGGCLAISGVVLFCLVPFILLMLWVPEGEFEAHMTPTAPIVTVVVTEPPLAPSNTASPAPTETAVPTASMTPSPIATVTATAIPVTQVRIVAAAANLRDGPGTDFAILGTLTVNDRVELLEQTDDGFWYQVRLPDGSTGWIGSSVAEIEQSNPLESDE